MCIHIYIHICMSMCMCICLCVTLHFPFNELKQWGLFSISYQLIILPLFSSDLTFSSEWFWSPSLTFQKTTPNFQKRHLIGSYHLNSAQASADCTRQSYSMNLSFVILPILGCWYYVISLFPFVICLPETVCCPLFSAELN